MCYASLHACTVCEEEKTIGTKIVLDAYDWRAHIGGKATQEGTKMRVQLYVDCKCRKTVARRAPWAAVVAKCDGGYMAFESVTDYKTWKGQK